MAIVKSAILIICPEFHLILFLIKMKHKQGVRENIFEIGSTPGEKNNMKVLTHTQTKFKIFNEKVLSDIVRTYFRTFFG